MKKNIIFIITITLICLALICGNIYNYNQIRKKSEANNKNYESFYNVDVLGTDIASLINKIQDENKKNNVIKNEKYIQNDTNSINLEIKFVEKDDVIGIEAIEKLGIEKFVQNFGAMKFKCKKIEYHSKTNFVKYMYIEEII